MRLRHIEYDARRAAPGCLGDLQVADFVVEDRRIEGEPALRIFDARFVVPQRLVFVSALAAEDLEVLWRAERHVQRIVDAAETEALGGLEVYAEIAIGFVARNEAGRDAIGLGFL